MFEVRGLKIYISVDFEGIAGIVLNEQIIRGNPLYEESRKIVTDEVNVIVNSLIKLGIKEIIVKDAHSSGLNFLLNELHSDAVYCLGATKMDNRFPGLDSSFDGALLIGYHAMGGTKGAVLDHTMSLEEWRILSLNGNPIGEIGIDSLLFGMHNVPVLLVSGDDKACEEARMIMPGIITYETKTGTARHAALTKAPKRIHLDMENVLKNALDSRISRMPLHMEGPYELTIDYHQSSQLDSIFFDGEQSKRLDAHKGVFKDSSLMRLLATRVM